MPDPTPPPEPPERRTTPNPMYARICLGCGGPKFTRVIYSRATFTVKHTVIICPVCDGIPRKGPTTP